MEDKLKKLEDKIIKRLHEIRNKEKKVLNDYTEYEELQEKLRIIDRVKNMLREE